MLLAWPGIKVFTPCIHYTGSCRYWHYFGTAYPQTLGPNCCLNSSSTDSSIEPTATKNLIHLSQSQSTSRKHFCCVWPNVIWFWNISFMHFWFGTYLFWLKQLQCPKSILINFEFFDFETCVENLVEVMDNCLVISCNDHVVIIEQDNNVRCTINFWQRMNN